MIVEHNRNSATFTYYIWDPDKQELDKVDKFKYENGGEYQKEDGSSVIFQFDDKYWKFVPK